MDKQKQIEEMAKDLDGCPYLCEGIGGNKHEGNLKISDFLYNAGYRKITENVVVLTMEEKQEYESLVKLLIYDKPIKSRVYEFIKDIKDRTRKETAEKFAERLQEKLEENSPIAGYDLEDLEFDGETIQECIDEIAKELKGDEL